jgi:hypothetical protein
MVKDVAAVAGDEEVEFAVIGDVGDGHAHAPAGAG